MVALVDWLAHIFLRGLVQPPVSEMEIPMAVLAGLQELVSAMGQWGEAGWVIPVPGWNVIKLLQVCNYQPNQPEKSRKYLFLVGKPLGLEEIVSCSTSSWLLLKRFSMYTPTNIHIRLHTHVCICAYAHICSYAKRHNSRTRKGILQIELVRFCSLLWLLAVSTSHTPRMSFPSEFWCTQDIFGRRRQWWIEAGTAIQL